MKKKSNINHLEVLQSESLNIQEEMRSGERKLNEDKLNDLQILQESTILQMDLKQLLQVEDFHYSNLPNNGMPDIFIAMTPYMIGKLVKYRKAYHFVTLDKLILENEQPRNIALLLTLNSNLQPSVLALAIFSDSRAGVSQVLQHLLMFINDRCQIDRMILFYNEPKLIQKSVQNYNAQFSKHITIQPTFSSKETQLKQILITTEMTRKPYLKKQAFQLIIHLLEEKDEKKFYKILEKFKDWNLQGYQKILQSQQNFKFIYEFSHNFYSFELFKKYDTLIQSFVKKIQKQKFSNSVQFVNRIVEQQYKQMELKRAPCIDQFGIFQSNSRVKELCSYVEPNPLNQFLQNYQRSLSFKHKKIGNSKYVIGGKTGTAYQVSKNLNGEWFCECGQTSRLGIPCEHLLKISCVQRLNFEEQIDSMYRIGHQKPFLRID